MLSVVGFFSRDGSGRRGCGFDVPLCFYPAVTVHHRQWRLNSLPACPIAIHYAYNARRWRRVILQFFFYYNIPMVSRADDIKYYYYYYDYHYCIVILWSKNKRILLRFCSDDSMYNLHIGISQLFVLYYYVTKRVWFLAPSYCNTRNFNVSS